MSFAQGGVFAPISPVKNAIAVGASIPASVGGWNAYDSLDNMDPTDAVLLDNFFPETSYLRLRRGYTQFCATGSTSPVQTLIEYNGGSTTKFLAAAGGHIYDITSGTASSLASGYNSDIWSYTNYSSGGGTFVLAANASGSDTPWVYNGSTIAPVSVTGPASAASLSMVMIYSQRAFYVQKGTLSVWYASSGAYQGALTQFDFGPLCVRGGSIASITTWTRDNGFGGSNELFVVLTTEGEVLVYQGTNPSDATAWSMVGRFLLGQPVSGPRPVTRLGPDMIMICEDGFQPLSNYLFVGGTKALATSISQKIGNAVTAAVRAQKAAAGWQALLYPQGNAIIVNVPQGGNVFWQFVVNTVTGAWCRFKNLNAFCWGLFNDQPYFGGANGIVYQWDTGAADNGNDIVGEWVPAFQYIGGRGVLKRFTMARPVFQTNGQLQFGLGVETDFVVSQNVPQLSSNPNVSTTWGSGIWGISLWGSANPTLQRSWTGVYGLGYAVAPHMKIATHTISLNALSIDLLYERGAFI